MSETAFFGFTAEQIKDMDIRCGCGQVAMKPSMRCPCGLAILEIKTAGDAAIAENGGEIKKPRPARS